MNEVDHRDSRVDWKPISGTGTNFASCDLKKIGDSRLDFIPTSGFLIFCLIFLAGGLFVLIRVIFYSDINEINLSVAIIVGSLFVLTGVYLLFVHRNRVIFKNYNGSWRISKSNVFAKKVKYLPNKPLMAIQVLEKYGDSISYELNVVYEDGSRENILDQDNRESIIKSATILAESLKIPFLNGVKVGIPFSKWGEFGPFK